MASGRSSIRSRPRPSATTRRPRSPAGGRSSRRRRPTSSTARRSSMPERRSWSTARPEIDADTATLAAGQAQLDAAKTAQRRPSPPSRRRSTRAGGSSSPARPSIDAGWATIREKQAEIDAGQARIATETQKVDAGATLLDLASGVRLVSEDGSAAVAAVMFDADPDRRQPPRPRTALMAAFRPAGRRRRGRLLVVHRIRDARGRRPRRARRPRRRRDRAVRHARHARRRPACPSSPRCIGVGIGVLGALAFSASSTWRR